MRKVLHTFLILGALVVISSCKSYDKLPKPAYTLQEPALKSNAVIDTKK